MRLSIIIIFCCILLGFGSGFYIKNQVSELRGDQIIGVSVLITVFVFFPLFIYYRSKGKKITDYMFTKENLDKMNNKEEKNTDNQ